MDNFKKQYPNLRKDDDRFWNINSIEAGLRYFRDLNGRYPREVDFDPFDFLPNWRKVKKYFGNLK